MSKDVLQTAMDLLSRRDHSQQELLRKLTMRGFSAESISDALATLSQKNLLDNTRFLENYIQYRRRKGFGPLRIQAELQQRGIGEELIEHHLNITDNAWFSEALHVWQKHFKNQFPNDYKTRAKQMRFLYQRGFTSEQIEIIFKKENP